MISREQEKSKRKLQAKVAKRAKLDPETAQTALDVQQNGLLRADLDEAGPDADGAEHSDLPQLKTKAATVPSKALNLSDGAGQQNMSGWWPQGAKEF